MYPHGVLVARGALWADLEPIAFELLGRRPQHSTDLLLGEGAAMENQGRSSPRLGVLRAVVVSSLHAAGR